MADVSLKQWVERRIKRLEDKKALSLKSVEDDELGYIERSTPYLYKVLFELHFYKDILLDAESEEEIKYSLEYYVRLYTNELMNGEIYRLSTNRMTNLCHQFKIEVKRDIIRDITNLLKQF
jgi:hypothetical protein